MWRLTEELRAKLKTPLGPVLRGGVVLLKIKGKKVIAVGDICLTFLLRNGVKPNIAVYDFRCMRKKIGAKEKRLIREWSKKPLRVKNPPGGITDDLYNAIGDALQKGKKDIFVEGEEDLATLAALVSAPLGWVVLYGQPDGGIVYIEVNKKNKENALALFRRMKKVNSN